MAKIPSRFRKRESERKKATNLIKLQLVAERFAFDGCESLFFKKNRNISNEEEVELGGKEKIDF